MKRLPIGISDFKEMITEDCYFIDKSLMIKDVVEGAKIILYPRPRRFGKTLNLSMIRYFYDNSQDNRNLFNGLFIEKEETIMRKQGKYPVIYMTFKDVKADNKKTAMHLIKELISKEYRRHKYLIESDRLLVEDKAYCKEIIDTKSDDDIYIYSLKNLSEYLSLYHGVNPIILIDEYDMPLHGAYTYGYYEEMVMFIRNLLSGCLKDNTYLEKAVLTGILRVAKESIFSGLNNLSVASIISEKSADKFGFLEKDIEEIVRHYEISDKLEEIKSWYNGYNFGAINIYNPWSILNYIYEKKLRPYWVNTSGNEMIKDLLGKADETVKRDLNILIEDGAIRKRIDDNIVYGELDKQEDVLWSFLLMSGYLRYDNFEKDGDYYYADLSIPNEEVKYLYRAEIVTRWFTIKNIRHGLDNVLKSLTVGDISDFRYIFIEFCTSCFSYFDVSGDESEKFYHAFVLGMVVTLRDSYEIRSNRESGYGRYDVMLIPKDKNKRGIIFEFKKVNRFEKETLETAMGKAKKQVIDKDYEAELRTLGLKNIVRVAAVFEGKDMEVEVF